MTSRQKQKPPTLYLSTLQFFYFWNNHYINAVPENSPSFSSHNCFTQQMEALQLIPERNRLRCVKNKQFFIAEGEKKICTNECMVKHGSV